jgi:hypothetical protein
MKMRRWRDWCDYRFVPGLMTSVPVSPLAFTGAFETHVTLAAHPDGGVDELALFAVARGVKFALIMLDCGRTRSQPMLTSALTGRISSSASRQRSNRPSHQHRPRYEREVKTIWKARARSSGCSSGVPNRAVLAVIDQVDSAGHGVARYTMALGACSLAAAGDQRHR